MPSCVHRIPWIDQPQKKFISCWSHSCCYNASAVMISSNSPVSLIYFCTKENKALCTSSYFKNSFIIPVKMSFNFLERKQKILDENHQQVQLIFVEAEKFENHWKKALNEQRVECRDHMKKQHENWNMQQRRLSLRPTSARNSITSSGSNDEENILLGAIDTASLDSKGEESSFVPVLEPVTEDVERIVDPATNNPIVVESLSDEEVVPSLQISQGNDQDVATSSSSNSEIGTVLSCEVQSSSSKTKSVRFDIPKSDI